MNEQQRQIVDQAISENPFGMSATKIDSVMSDIANLYASISVAHRNGDGDRMTVEFRRLLARALRGAELSSAGGFTPRTSPSTISAARFGSSTLDNESTHRDTDRTT